MSRPKCYAFDTGFVTFEKGWTRIREDDRGLLWEHLVLDSLRFRHLDENIFYWRDKAGREVDFTARTPPFPPRPSCRPAWSPGRDRRS